jgi:glycosyltransferase involved in cell wall biosynthesis
MVSRSLSQDEEPLVSVIIPSYGRAQYLSDAIESVRQQSHPRREILVVDDGSVASGVADVARRYDDVRYLWQEHAGVCEARNHGVRESRGELLVFLDSDDRLLPNALEDGVRAMASHAECAFAYGRSEWMNADGLTIDGPALEQVVGEHYRALLHSNFIIIDTVMHRRSTFEAVGGFRPRFAAVEDYDLYLRLARRYPVHNHGKLVARYRRHAENMSGNARVMLAGVVRLLEQERQMLRDPELRVACRDGIANLRDYWGDKVVSQLRAAARGGRWRAAGREAASLLRYHPALLAAQVRGALRTRLSGSHDRVRG